MIEDGNLRYQGRRWVPDVESTKTRMLQEAHDAILTSQPERGAMYAILARQVYPPAISEDIQENRKIGMS